MGTFIQGQYQGPGTNQNQPTRYKLKLLRKFLHIFSGVLALIFYFFPHQETVFIFILSVLIILSLIFDVLRLTFPHINDFTFRNLNFLFVERDKHKINSAIFYFIGCLITVVIFPVEIAVVGILYLSVGDTMAAVGGISLSGKIPVKIPGTSKTMIGSLTFILVALLIAKIFGMPWKVAALSALAGAVAEALPLGIDDNFTIPLTSSFVIWLLV